MKKELKIIGLSFLVLLGGCSNPETTRKEEKTSETQETAGCSEEAACEAGEYSTAGMKEISFDEAIELFENKESGLLYFGFPDCPWCEEAVPVLTEEAGKAGVPILYVRTRDENKERLYTDAQKEEITPFIKDYMQEDDKGDLALYVPLVLHVEKGVVTAGHEGTVEGHDAHERTMTEEETASLHQIYKDLLGAD